MFTCLKNDFTHGENLFIMHEMSTFHTILIDKVDLDG